MQALQQDERSRLQPMAGQPSALQGPGLANGVRPAQYQQSDVLMDAGAGIGTRPPAPQVGPPPPVPTWQRAALPPLPGRSPPWAGVPGPQAMPRASPPLSPGHPVSVVGPPPLTLPPSLHYVVGSGPPQASALPGRGHDQLPGALANGHTVHPGEHGAGQPTSTDSSIASVMAGTPMTSDSGSHLSSSGDSPRWASASSAELMSSADSPRSGSQQAGGSGPPSSVAAPRSHGRGGSTAGDDPHDFGVADAGALQRFQHGRAPAGRQPQQQHQQQQAGEGSRRHSADLPPMNQQRARREADARNKLDLRSHRSVEGDQVHCRSPSLTLSLMACRVRGYQLSHHALFISPFWHANSFDLLLCCMRCRAVSPCDLSCTEGCHSASQAFGREADAASAPQSDWAQLENGRTDRPHGTEAFLTNLQPIQTQPCKQPQQRPRRGSGTSLQGGRATGSARSTGASASVEDPQQRNFALHSAPSSPARALQQQHAHVFLGGPPQDVHAAHAMANGGGTHMGGLHHHPPALARHDRSRSFTSLGGLAAASQAQHAAQHFAQQQQAHQHAAQQSHQQQQQQAAAAAALAANPFKALSAVFAPHQLAALAAANGARHRLQVPCSPSFL